MCGGGGGVCVYVWGGILKISNLEYCQISMRGGILKISNLEYLSNFNWGAGGYSEDLKLGVFVKFQFWGGAF